MFTENKKDTLAIYYSADLVYHVKYDMYKIDM